MHETYYKYFQSIFHKNKFSRKQTRKKKKKKKNEKKKGGGGGGGEQITHMEQFMVDS
jgi:hypothetical protein